VRSALLCPLHYLREHRLVGTMHPIEVAHAEDGRAKVSGHFLEMVKDPHCA